MQTRFETLIKRLDEEIKRGRADEAQRELRSLSLSRIPREYAAEFANLARRARVPRIGVQILKPIVRADRPLSVQPTSRELAAYAAALSRLGAIDEALSILQNIKDTTPEVLLFTAFAYILRWDYAGAIPWLKRYVQNPDLAAYERLVGKINLASAYIAESQVTDCEELLLEILSIATANDWRLLAVTAQELRAQCAFLKGDLADARAFLQTASKQAQVTAMDSRFIEKWSILVDLRACGATPSIVAEAERFRNDSVERKDWESVRHVDYHLAFAKKDEELFTHVYAGTPHLSFRKKMQEDARDWFEIPPTCVWNTCKNQPAPLVDTISGHAEDSDGKALLPLKPRQGPHRLLQALLTDFYKPILGGTLFSLVFPGEHYDPKFSPKRIEQLVMRLRKWFDENALPLTIEVSEGNYRLVISGPVRLRVDVESNAALATDLNPLANACAELKMAWPYKAFTTKQAAETLGTDLESTRRLLNDAVEAGYLIRVGQGRGTLFRFPSRNEKKS